MCEEEVLAKTGRSVEEHQELTIESYLQLRAIAPDLEDLFLPVLQGASPEDYLRHFELWLLRGVDLRQVDTVGVGSICRCWEDSRLRDIFEALNKLGLRRLHGFGAKRTSFRWDAILRSPTRPDVAELYHRAFERGLPYEVLETALQRDPEYGATTWEDELLSVCRFMYSADSAAWSRRAREHQHAVIRARDAAYGKGWHDEGFYLYQGGQRVGRIRVELAGREEKNPEAPTQMLEECALRRAHWRRGPGAGRRPHANCSQCAAWALTDRQGIKELLVPRGCWDEAPYLRRLPAPSFEPYRRALDLAAQRQREWAEAGPERFAHLMDLPPWARLEALRRRGELGEEDLALYVRTLQEVAPYDPDAQGELELWRQIARVQRETGENPPVLRWPVPFWRLRA
jgi:hypothetical protein